MKIPSDAGGGKLNREWKSRTSNSKNAEFVAMAKLYATLDCFIFRHFS
jgi:hypothetical protein